MLNFTSISSEFELYRRFFQAFMQKFIIYVFFPVNVIKIMFWRRFNRKTRAARTSEITMSCLELLFQEMQDKYPNNPFIPHVKFGFLLFFVLLICLTIFGIVRFRLSRVVGISFCSMYVVFIIYAIVQEFACDEGFGC